MNYTISRNGQEFGPYSLADLQHYVSTGDVQLTDMARSEGMTEFMPVSQIVGTIAVPAQATTITVPAVEYPDPPNLHWALVLLLSFVTCGLFAPAWGLVLSAWMRKVNPKSQAMNWYIAYAATIAIVFVLSFASSATRTHGNPNAAISGLVGLLQIASWVLKLVARFTLRSSLEDHFNNAEKMGLGLSGVMTFFFGIVYFQYHLNDISNRKKFDRELLASR